MTSQDIIDDLFRGVWALVAHPSTANKDPVH
jgi:hypothetical protein